jgi:hypothetical protein
MAKKTSELDDEFQNLTAAAKKKAKRPAADEDDEPASLKKKAKRPAVEEEDEDEKPAKKKAKRPVVEDDDEDEKPVKKKAKRPAADEDDDEDEKPAKKKKAKKGGGAGREASPETKAFHSRIIKIVNAKGEITNIDLAKKLDTTTLKSQQLANTLVKRGDIGEKRNDTNRVTFTSVD